MDFENNYQTWSHSKRGDEYQSLPLTYNSQPVQSEEEQVVKELGKILAAGRRRAIVIIVVASVVTVAIGFLMSRKTPTYQGKFQLLVEPLTNAESKLQSLLSETQGEDKPRIREFGLDYMSQIEVLKSPKVMMPITEKIQEKYPKITYKELASKLKITRPFIEDEGTRLLEVYYKDTDPDRVEFILQQVADAYQSYSLKAPQTNLIYAVNSMEELLPLKQGRLDSLRDELQRYRQEYKVIDPLLQGDQLIRQSRDIEQKQLEIQANLDEAITTYAELQKMLVEGNATALLSQDPVAYRQLLARLQDVDIEIATKSARWNEDHPSLKSLRAEQASLQAMALNEAQTIVDKAELEVNQMQDRYESIAQAQQDLQQRIRELPGLARRYEELQQELDVATKTFKDLLTKLEALKIEVAQRKVPWELILPPQIPRASDGTPLTAPSVTKKDIVLAGILGLALGIGVAFVLEILNNVFHTADELEEDTRLSLIGVIPFAKELKKKSSKKSNSVNTGLMQLKTESHHTEKKVVPLVIEVSTPVSNFHISPMLTEAFRSLYTNIRLLSPERPFRSLVIGASTVGEGKSTIAVNLAKTAASIGQRVLLVDADLRNPKIHLKLDLPNLRGLTDTISTDLSLNDAIQRSTNDENLFVLTAGSLADDPIKLLSSKKVYSLIEQFQDFFDLVIYDTPPLVGFADSSILLKQTDGLLFVVKLDHTDRSLVMKALDGLKISGGSVLGVVANGKK